MRGVSCITSDTSGVHSGRGQRQRRADSPKGGRQQGCGLATEKGVAWPGLAVLGGSGGSRRHVVYGGWHNKR